MKKLLPVVISGVMAISFSQFAAAQKADVQGPAGTGANVDLNSKGSADAQTNQELGQSRQQPGSHDTQSGKKTRDSSATTGATTGATAGATADTNASAGASKSEKMEGDDKDKDKDKDKNKNKSKDNYGSSTSGSSK